MAARIARLGEKLTAPAGTAISAPYAATQTVVHRVTRFRPYDFYDFVAIVRGTGHAVLYSGSRRPRTLPVAAGQVLMFRPVDEVMLESLQSEGLTVQNVSAPIDAWDLFSNLAGIDAAQTHTADPPHATFAATESGEFPAFTQAVDRFHRGATPYDLVRFLTDVSPVLFPRSLDRRPEEGAPPWLHAAITTMRQESELRQGFPRLLHLARVTPAHLASTTRRFYGVTPTELVLELRLRHAAMLLVTTADPVGEIAERCGFKSFSYFSTAFRRKHDVGPRDYRQRSRDRLTR
jgi:AraC family cel operon transcriptional repressor